VSPGLPIPLWVSEADTGGSAALEGGAYVPLVQVCRIRGRLVPDVGLRSRGWATGTSEEELLLLVD
jgi:hypothetical protein